MGSWKLADVPALAGARGFSRVDQVRPQGCAAAPGWFPARSAQLASLGCDGAVQGVQGRLGEEGVEQHSTETDRSLSLIAILI